jgi:cysteine desulfurase
VPEPRAHGAIRFGLGRFNTKEEVDSTLEILVESVKVLRGRSPLYKSRKEV